MRVNGENVQINEGIRLSEYLEQQGYAVKRVAVERNGEIVPKGMYEDCVLNDSDTLEIVHFVGGG